MYQKKYNNKFFTYIIFGFGGGGGIPGEVCQHALQNWII